MNARTNTKGFTIIEVVLVLAIAALIFLMVFVALPALNRGQANTARKSDVSTIAAAINTYRTNNNGDLPSDYGDLGSYVDKLSQLEFDDQTSFQTGAGATMGSDDGARKANLDKVQVVLEAKCSGQTTISGSSRQAAVQTVVETSAGKYTTFCQDS
jgi:type IV pilus assembly protein PilA